MSKIKLTKGELKRQRDNLKQFQHYLPTLQLKKQQLQTKILEIKRILDEKEETLQSLKNRMLVWIGLLGDPFIDISQWIIPKDIVTEKFNIAGVDIPILLDVLYEEASYDFYATPFWIDQGIDDFKVYFTALSEIEVIKKQIAILNYELKITTQRVNLFEKVKIPECLENIRLIRIYLGDQMANAVGISKVAKRKIEVSSYCGAST